MQKINDFCVAFGSRNYLDYMVIILGVWDCKTVRDPGIDSPYQCTSAIRPHIRQTSSLSF